MNSPAPLNPAIETARAHQRAGRLREAEAAYRQVLARDPDHVDALQGLGTLAMQAGRADLALPLFQRVARLSTSAPFALFNLASVLRVVGRREEALAQYELAASRFPNLPDAHCEYGNMLAEVGRDAEAKAAFDRALSLDPYHARTHYNLGVSLRNQGRFDAALGHFRAAIGAQPNLAAAHNQIGSTLRDMDRPGEAIPAYQRAIQLEPRKAAYHNNLALACQDLLRMGDALAGFDRALAVDPRYTKGRAFRALALLLTGDFARGLPDYEYRLQVGDLPPRKVDRPAWNGSDPAGKTILLHAEQGLGDTIHFARYAPLLAKRGARVVVECQPPLERLLRSLDGAADVVAKGNQLPPFDLHRPLPSLAHLFGTRLDTIPSEVPYLQAPPEEVERFRGRLAPFEGSFKVGIVWAGAAGHRNDRNRSVPLAMFAPLSAEPGVKLFSLQKGPPAEQLAGPSAPPVEDLGPELNDFADTAAAMHHLDLVISVDTSAAHLAGALGRPVCTLLPFSPDWRWLLDRSDSPWYPTMRLFRQPAIGAWASVFEEVTVELSRASRRA